MQLRWLLVIWSRYHLLTIPKWSRDVRCMVIGDGHCPCGIYSSICRVHVFLNPLRSQVVQTYFFARDDRVYKAFTGVLDKYKNEIQKHVNRRLRWQLNILRTTLEGRSITYRVSESIKKWVQSVAYPCSPAEDRATWFTTWWMRDHNLFSLPNLRLYKVPHRLELTPGCLAYRRANKKHQCPTSNHFCCWHTRSLLSPLSHVYFT